MGASRTASTSKESIDWQSYPQTRPLPQHLGDVVRVFEAAHAVIGSGRATLKSNAVLKALSAGLTDIGYEVESGSTRAEKVHVPVLFGRRNSILKAFEVDAWSVEHGTVIEVEAGAAVANNRFLKDLFEACVMPGVDYTVIAVRLRYRDQNDFSRVCAYIDSLYASDRLTLFLRGVLIIGY
jgi:hypothetical protein